MILEKTAVKSGFYVVAVSVVYENLVKSAFRYIVVVLFVAVIFYVAVFAGLGQDDIFIRFAERDDKDRNKVLWERKRGFYFVRDKVAYHAAAVSHVGGA